MLVGIAGLPGSGKTKITWALEKQGFKGLHRDDFITFLFNPVDYSSRAQKDLAFKIMLAVAEYYLKHNKNVALDCPSFSQKWAVNLARATAKKAKTKFKLIYCQCPDEIAIKRIKKAKHHIATDRTPKLYFEVKARFEPIKIKHKKINTNRPLAQTIKEVNQYLKK
ncbi:MAG: AAA family ATPase [Patescibacteria group bacterium]|jgi:predicted kinase